MDMPRRCRRDLLERLAPTLAPEATRIRTRARLIENRKYGETRETLALETIERPENATTPHRIARADTRARNGTVPPPRLRRGVTESRLTSTRFKLEKCLRGLERLRAAGVTRDRRDNASSFETASADNRLDNARRRRRQGGRGGRGGARECSSAFPCQVAGASARLSRGTRRNSTRATTTVIHQNQPSLASSFPARATRSPLPRTCGAGRRARQSGIKLYSEETPLNYGPFTRNDSAD